MPKLRKQRRKKVYNHRRNRKRMRNKQFSEGNIKCKAIKSAWDAKKSHKMNLEEMGLCYDPNSTFKITVTRAEKVAKVAALVASDIDDVDKNMAETSKTEALPAKRHVVQSLIEDANAPRVKMFRLPKGQVEFLSYMLTKYGLDYKAMAKDKKNYKQETWKQLRRKIQRFKSIPEQYQSFLEQADENTRKQLNQDVPMEDDD